MEYTKSDFEQVLPSILSTMESETVEYKTVLPPSRTIAKILCAFANNKGGYLILGVHEADDRIEIVGLSSDFQAENISRKAIGLLSPQPTTKFEYAYHDSKKLFVIAVDPSSTAVSLEGQIYRRRNTSIEADEPEKQTFKRATLPQIEALHALIKARSKSQTNAKRMFHQHITSVLNIVNELPHLLFPSSASAFATHLEGRILSRILFSSCADTFESYLSDLLIEIFLAHPVTLKSLETITVEEVLDCSDLEEFIEMWARKKVAKIQKGSVKGFIKDTKAINALNALTTTDEQRIEGILQIRHLYAHRNGIVDEKFLFHHPGSFALNSEHQMSIIEFLGNVEFLANAVDRIDSLAITKYSLATS